MSLRLLGAWVLVATVAASATACSPSLNDLDAAVENARACTPGDSCQLEGATPCSCATAVNSAQAMMVRQIASHVSCPAPSGDAGAIQCPTQVNPRCVNMRCVADRF